MSQALERQERELQFHKFVELEARDVVAALPMNVRTVDLQRAKVRLRTAFSMRSAGDKIFNCTPKSVANCIAMSAITGLMPGGHNPDVDIIPRNIKDQLTLTWQISYRGYKRLAKRAGYDLEAVLVFEEDFFDYEEGQYPRIDHKPSVQAEKSWATLALGYVRVFPSGERDKTQFEVLNKAQIQQRRDCAMSDVFWSKWPLEQAKKTLCRYAGQREMFPCDDPARYALQQDIQEDVRSDEHVIKGSRDAATLDMFATPQELPALEGEVIDGDEAEPESRASPTEAAPRAAKSREGGPPWETIGIRQVEALRKALKEAKMSEASLLGELGIDEISKIEEIPKDDFMKAAKLVK